MLSYGSVSLIGVGDCDRRDLSPLVVQALGAADAVIHDPGIPKTILDLTNPSGHREVVTLHGAIDRLIKLARDGWRVVHLVADDTIERVVDTAIRCAEHNIPLCILPNTAEFIGGDAPLALLLVARTLAAGRANPGSTFVLLAATPQWTAEMEIAQRQPPADFPMPGLAG
jgi:siroheme synthase